MLEVAEDDITTTAVADTEAARVAALRDYQVLDTEAERSFDRISRAAADVCGTSMAVVSFIDDYRSWPKSSIGFVATETPRELSFCMHALQHDGVMIVRDATLDTRFAANPFVTGTFGLRFYAGAPLCTADGHRLGTLCVLDRSARGEGLTGVQSRMLETLAAQVVAELELRRTVARLHWAAHHDALTGLPNRLLFHECLGTALLTAAARRGYRIGVALLDLDDFKQVNDAYGHDAGDALLRHVATVLAGFAAPGETAARLGGDEFILILPDCGPGAALTRRMDDLMARLRQPFWFNGHRLDGRASIGMACSPGQGRDAGTLLKHADLAMYQAKAAGRGLASMYRTDLGTEAARRVGSGNAVRTAIHNGDVFPLYQPQYDLVTGAIVGCEALVRYRDEAGKIHLPSEIEDVLEDRELGVEVGARMVACVIHDMRRWLDAGIDVGPVAINAAAVELRRADYAPSLLRALADAGLAPSRLRVEVIESVFVGRGAERVAETLRALSAGGIAIALDDFGTGFASLSHLKNYPVDIIKIDRSFIACLADNAVDVTIVTAVIRLAARLGMAIVAEGVETARQADILRAIGCTVVQGFHFARPMPADTFATTWRALAAAPSANRNYRLPRTGNGPARLAAVS